MRALLDVNVLIALLDADHVHHRRAHDWLDEHLGSGWASCPITQNGCIRVLAQSGYTNPLPATQVAERLAEAADSAHHRFWPDSVSLLDSSVIDRKQFLSPRQVTDAYLLALAVVNKGRLVTFDRGISPTLVKGAEKRHLHFL